jgi:3-methylcrotonyl-CoA carboxylase beta subunit
MTDEKTLEKNNNEAVNLQCWTDIKQLQAKIYKGGGDKAIAKLKEKNKFTVRERIELLIDKDQPFLEIGSFVGYEMYAAEGGCPAGGTVGGLGTIAGRLCVILANDPTVKAGAWFPITGKKNLRLQEIAMENNLPIIYLVDSAGVYLPMQDEIFPDKEHFGRIFRNNAKMSAQGITQIAAVFGPCVAGGAYLPIMSDETLMVKGNGSIFLAGPYLVKAAIGENIDAETLGGADTHNEISGIADYNCENETECIQMIRKLCSNLPNTPTPLFKKIKGIAPAKKDNNVYNVFAAGGKPYDMMDLINCIADEESIIPYKDAYGKSIVTCYAKIDGWSVGIVANQRLVLKNKKGELQMGGVIYNDSADKAARFILNCNQKKIPLVFLQDVTGFMVGSRSEHAGIIKDGAKLVNAVANSVVPKITIIVGNSYGAGNYAMCGKAYDPRFIYAWPTAKIAVMGGEQAAKTLLQIQVAALKAKGKTITEQEEASLLEEIKAKYDNETKVTYAAARLWVDEIIEPSKTRWYISQSLWAAAHNTSMPEFKLGVFQV